jgi:hypothetical protein
MALEFVLVSTIRSLAADERMQHLIARLGDVSVLSSPDIEELAYRSCC